MIRGRGVCYDTGAHPHGTSTRPDFDEAEVRRELEIIARDLHCTAVRITGGEPERLSVAAEAAAEQGLEVWFSPFLCQTTARQTGDLLLDCAERAERVRAQGAEVVLVAGAELSLFTHGFLPGDDLFARMEQLAQGALAGRPATEPRGALREVPARLDDFFADLLPGLRAAFGGPIGYAATLYERIDWGPFDLVGVDAYRGRTGVDRYPDQLRALRVPGKRLAITEFGCCGYAGAGERGGKGWLIVDREADPQRLHPGYVRDEQEQVRYLRELLAIFDEVGVDSAFWFTFAGYPFPDRSAELGPDQDLDLASYGLVRVLGSGTGRRYPGLPWEPKAAFDALAACYR